MLETSAKNVPLAQRDCIPCRGNITPLPGEDLTRLQSELGGGWLLKAGRRLEKEFRFPDFREALGFANQVGALAESVGHHPDLLVSWGLTRVTVWTHKIGGLSEADFVFAAKVDRLKT